MRVLVTKSSGGKRTVTVLPANAPGKRPVVLRGLSRHEVRAAVADAVEAVRRQGPASPPG